MRLFHYDHCPYCVKARMIFGLKGVPFELIPLENDNEILPVNMIGVKMVPILQKNDGKYMPESMDIVAYVDGLSKKPVVSPALDASDPSSALIESFLGESREYLNPLAMPRWVNMDLPEFENDSARAYFIRKKESLIGSFEEALSRSSELIRKAEAALASLENAPALQDVEDKKSAVSVTHFHLFAALRSLSCVKGLSFPPRVLSYMETLSRRAKVPLYLDQAP